MCKTADGTVDGTGKVIGDAKADHRNDRRLRPRRPGVPHRLRRARPARRWRRSITSRRAARSPTGATTTATASIASWPASPTSTASGRAPSSAAATTRGAVLVAWDWRDGKLTRRWTFDSDDGTPGNRAYRGQGNHSLSVARRGRRRQGRHRLRRRAASATTARGCTRPASGHGDALHVSDLDPDRPGLEVFNIHERTEHEHRRVVPRREDRQGALEQASRRTSAAAWRWTSTRGTAATRCGRPARA